MARSTRLVESIVALIVSEISAYIRTDRQTGMARSTRLGIYQEYIYFMGSETLLPEYICFMGSETLPSACYIISETLPSACTYFPTDLVYPFTLRVTGIMMKNHIN